MNIRNVILKSPEYILLILLFLAAYTPPFYFNPVFGVFMLLVLVQIIFRNKLFGIILSSIYFLGNLYFLAALISEFNEFEEFTSGAQNLLFWGLSIWFLNLFCSSIMIYNYTRSSLNKNEATAIKA
ncbi:MAG: hypothetical protein AAGC47_04030 [Bacteroidota bacterium]